MGSEMYAIRTAAAGETIEPWPGLVGVVEELFQDDVLYPSLGRQGVVRRTLLCRIRLTSVSKARRWEGNAVGQAQEWPAVLEWGYRPDGR